MLKTSIKKVHGAIIMYPTKITLEFRDEKPEVFKMQLMRANVIKGSEIAAYAAKAAHVPESTIAMAQEALFDAANYFCLNGHSVQVPGLGSFALQINSKTAASADEANADKVTKKYIRFWPIANIRDMCQRKNISIRDVDLLGLPPKKKEEGD